MDFPLRSVQWKFIRVIAVAWNVMFTTIALAWRRPLCRQGGERHLMHGQRGS